MQKTAKFSPPLTPRLRRALNLGLRPKPHNCVELVGRPNLRQRSNLEEKLYISDNSLFYSSNPTGQYFGAQ
jgi:hypothetical protein